MELQNFNLNQHFFFSTKSAKSKCKWGKGSRPPAGEPEILLTAAGREKRQTAGEGCTRSAAGQGEGLELRPRGAAGGAGGATKARGMSVSWCRGAELVRGRPEMRRLLPAAGEGGGAVQDDGEAEVAGTAPVAEEEEAVDRGDGRGRSCSCGGARLFGGGARLDGGDRGRGGGVYWRRRREELLSRELACSGRSEALLQFRDEYGGAEV